MYMYIYILVCYEYPMVCEKTHSRQLPARPTVCCRANSSVSADQQVPVPLGGRAALTKTVLTSYSKIRLDVEKLQLISKPIVLLLANSEIVRRYSVHDLARTCTTVAHLFFVYLGK